MSPYIKGMIELKAATHFSENTYTDRAKSFDRFYKEHFPFIKNPYVSPINMLNGKSIFIPYIFTDDKLKDLFYHINISEKGTAFERIPFSTYFRLAYTCGLRPYEVRTLKQSNIDLNS